MDEDNDDMVCITQEEWDDIQRKLDWLDSLNVAGVDNWEGVELAHEVYRAFHKAA